MLSLLLTSALALPTLPHQDPVGAPAIPTDTEIVTTESGLKYSILEKGPGGEQPKLGDRVRVHYTGWLPDGSIFDSSVQRGVPAEFGLGHVIEGWNEGLQLMQIGDRFKFTITPALGYGEGGTPDGAIPPGAILIFEVELLAITTKTMPFLPWVGGEGSGATRTEGGTDFTVLTAGEGAPARGAELLVIDFAFWSDEGEVLQSTALNGRPLLASPAQLPLPFLAELLELGHLKGGTHVHFRVPTSAMAGLGFDGHEHVVGQIKISAVLDFSMPAFRLPADEELTTTESGLKYKILVEGGPFRAGAGARVAAHYAGWLTDGTPFDASYGKPSPLQASLTQLVKGWQEGMRLVGRGGKILLVVPPSLGYGNSPKATIPAGSTLVFVVELIDFQG